MEANNSDGGAQKNLEINTSVYEELNPDVENNTEERLLRSIFGDGPTEEDPQKFKLRMLGDFGYQSDKATPEEQLADIRKQLEQDVQIDAVRRNEIATKKGPGFMHTVITEKGDLGAGTPKPPIRIGH